MYNLCRACVQMKGVTKFAAHNEARCEMVRDREKKLWKCSSLECPFSKEERKYLNIDKWKCKSCPDTYLCFECCQLKEPKRGQYAYVRNKYITYSDKNLDIEGALIIDTNKNMIFSQKFDPSFVKYARETNVIPEGSEECAKILKQLWDYPTIIGYV